MGQLRTWRMALSPFVAFALGGASAAIAAPTTTPFARHRFDIPAGPAAAALQLYAKQTGRQILFPFDAVARKTVARIKGTRSDKEVLLRLARASGLTVISETSSVIVLARSPSPPPPRVVVREPVQPSPRAAAFRQRRAPPVALASAPVGTPMAPPDIIVTATKRSQAARTVPVAIDVVPGQSLGTLGVHTPADLQNILPGVASTTVQHGVSIKIRGVATSDITSKGEQGIAFSVDGIAVGRPIQQGGAFFDLERIEVLRGPQGTLYGKSSTGGAINIVTRKPVDRWEAYATFESGSFDTQRGEGAINIPVTNGLAVRLAGAFNSHNGYLTPSDGGQRKSSQSDQTIRASALGHIGGAVTGRLTLTAGHVGGTGAGYAELGNFLDGGSSAARRTVYPNPFPAGLDHRFLNIDGEVDARIRAVQLTYVGGRQHFRANERSSNNNDPNDPNFPYPGTDIAVQMFGRYRARITSDIHELRIANLAPSPIDYVIGANYVHERIDEDDHNLSAPLGDADPSGAFNYNDIIGTTRHTSLGVFGQASARVTNQLAIVAGLRYSDDSVRREATAAFGLYGADGLACYGLADCVGNSAPGHERASKLTYRAGINWQPGSGALIYGSVATGYKAGGFNDAVTPTAPTTRYEPEQLVAYEVGYKGRPTADLQLQSALYYYDYARSQINGVIYVNGSGVLNTRVVPTVLYGWENQGTWAPSPHLAVTITAALERSRYVRFQAGFFQNADWSGLTLDQTPAFVGTVAVDRDWPLGDGWALRLHAFSKISSPYYLSEFASALHFRQRAFTRSDATLTLAAPGDQWVLQAFVRNVEDSIQAASAPQNYDAAYLNAAYLNVTDPRVFGLRVGVKLR